MDTGLTSRQREQQLAARRAFIARAATATAALALAGCSTAPETTAESASGAEHRCRSVVVALPPTLRSRIVFEPALPDQVVCAACWHRGSG